MGSYQGLRWFPSELEKQQCCVIVREPTRAYPDVLKDHCRSAGHVAMLHDVRYEHLKIFHYLLRHHGQRVAAQIGDELYTTIIAFERLGGRTITMDEGRKFVKRFIKLINQRSNQDGDKQKSSEV